MGVDMQIQDVLMGRRGVGGVEWWLGGRPVRQALRHGLAALLSDSALLGPC